MNRARVVGGADHQVHRARPWRDGRAQAKVADRAIDAGTRRVAWRIPEFLRVLGRFWAGDSGRGNPEQAALPAKPLRLIRGFFGAEGLSERSGQNLFHIYKFDEAAKDGVVASPRIGDPWTALRAMPGSWGENAL